MDIKTSINISLSRKKRLLEAARTLKIPVREVLSALMARSRLHYDQLSASLWKTVDYQPDAIFQGEEYSIMHVRLDPLCYEFGVSSRLVFKVSVSFIFRVMIDLFLDDLVENGLNSPVCEKDISTNYTALDYTINFSEIETHEFWQIIWERRTKYQKKE